MTHCRSLSRWSVVAVVLSVTATVAWSSLLTWGSFLGGPTDNHGVAVAVDEAGNLYVTGHTRDNFPVTAGAYQTTYGGGNRDAFVAKISADGSTLLWATYLGGTDTEQGDGGTDIAVDGQGLVYVTGFTMSSNFPTTAGAYDGSYAGGPTTGDAFAAVLSADGSALLYSTYLGGDSDDWGRGIDVDAAGDMYLTGLTNGGFPTTAGAYDVTYNGGLGGVGDAYFVKLSPDGNGAADLLYGTYIGGPLGDTGNTIDIDAAGVAHIGGFTMGGFPTTGGAFQTASAGPAGDGFVTKIKAGGPGNDLLYSTYYGGSGTDAVTGLEVDGQGDIFFAGTCGSGAGFPFTAGAFQTSHAGGTYDAFAAQLTPAGGGAADLVYGTFIGGSGDEYPVGEYVHNGVGIALGCSDMVYVHCITQSSDFPTTTGTYDNSLSGGDDGTIVKLDFGGNGAADLLYGTYLGGGGEEHWYGIAVTGTNDVAFVTGATSLDYPGSTQPSDFPTTAGTFQPAYGGGYEDAAVTLAGFTDFGDAPDTYGTTIAANGPRHVLGPLRLGVAWDAEPDGLPSAGAVGDDVTADWPDDEDGVLFLGSSPISGGPYFLPYQAGEYGAVTVTVTGGSGWLAGWFDWNLNDVFDNPSERAVFQAVAAGTFDIEFTVPAFPATLPGITHARFRLAPVQADVANPTASAAVCGGEVEDYGAIPIPVELSSFSATPVDGGVELAWVTQSESDNLGYHIYRATDSGGEYIKITEDLIPGAGNSSTDQHYRYVDDTVVAGATYSYMLGDISFSGVEARHGPVTVSVPAVVSELYLRQAVPTPILTTGEIHFGIPAAGKTKLALYDIAGREQGVLINSTMEAGLHSITLNRADINGQHLGAGSYILKLVTESGVASRTIVIAD